MNILKQITPELWPRANYSPVAYINLEPSYFIEKLNLNFFVECDDLGECESCLLKLERTDIEVYFYLFRYVGVEEGLNILCDMSMPDMASAIRDVLACLEINNEYVTLKE